MGWNSFSYAFGPVLALAGVGILVLILRWSHRPGGSLVERPVRPASEDEYGMLVPIANPANYADGERLRCRLSDANITSTLAFTIEGPRLMVWPQDEAIARATLNPRPSR